MREDPDSTPIRLVERWNRLLLRLYPSSFRRDFGPAILAAYDRLAREAHTSEGSTGLIYLVLRSLGDSLTVAARERCHQLGQGWQRLCRLVAAADWSVSAFRNDFRRALKQIRQHSAASASIGLTLTLALAASAGALALFRVVAPATSSYSAPDRLVELQVEAPDRSRFAPVEVAEVARYTKTLQQVEEIHTMWFILSENSEPERLRAAVISSGFADLLGLRPILGDSLAELGPSDQPEAAVLLGHRFWRQRFSSDPGVVGRMLRFTDHSRRILGVLPPNPQWDRQDIFVLSSSCPFRSRVAASQDRGGRMLRLFARLRPEVTLDQVRTDLAHTAARLRREHPAIYDLDFELTLAPLTGWGSVDPTARALLLAVALLLLAASTTGALLAARRPTLADPEDSEPTQRDPVRNLRQSLAESWILALGSSLLGLALAVTTAAPLARFILPDAQPLRIDGRIALSILGCGLLSATLIGLVATRSVRSDPAYRQFSGVLLLLQLTAASCLLLGAGLTIRGMLNLESARPAGTILAADLDLNFFRHWGDEGIIDFRRSVLAELASRPEIGSTAFATHLPFDAPDCDCSLQVRDGLSGDLEASKSVPVRRIDPGFLRLVSAPIVAGRDFEERDGPTAPRVAIVSQDFARQSWGSGSAVGRQLSLDRGETWLEVVGVADDGSYNARLYHAEPSVYLPLLQDPELSLRLVLRPNGSLERATAALVEAIHAVDPQQPVNQIRTLAGAYDELIVNSRGRALLLGLFAMIALLAATLGVTAAAGNTPARPPGASVDVEHTLGTIKRASAWALPALGLALLAASSTTRTLWVAVEPTDPGTLLSVASLLIAVVTVASLLGERGRRA